MVHNWLMILPDRYGRDTIWILYGYYMDKPRLWYPKKGSINGKLLFRNQTNSRSVNLKSKAKTMLKNTIVKKNSGMLSLVFENIGVKWQQDLCNNRRMILGRERSIGYSHPKPTQSLLKAIDSI